MKHSSTSTKGAVSDYSVSMEKATVLKPLTQTSSGSAFSHSPAPNTVWYAFYVKPRHEKKALERLSEQFETGEPQDVNDDCGGGAELFCPLKEERVKWSDRWKTVTKPYIPGYLFARVTENQRRTILEDPSVYRTVMWKGRPAKIRDEEIELVKRVIGDPGVDDLRLEALQPGDRVEVTGGELMNMNGVVVMVKGNCATILLESMHCNMTFTVDRSLLEAVG